MIGRPPVGDFELVGELSEPPSRPPESLTSASAILLLIGMFGPWQRTLFGASANGLEVAPVQLVGAALFAGYALYDHGRGHEGRRKRIGVLLIASAVLAGLAVAGNAEHIGGLVILGWGPVVAAVGAAGLLVAGVQLLRHRSPR